MKGNKTLIALIVVVVVAALAYYMLVGSVEAPTAMNAPDSLPEATDSVDDFAASMQADLDATASALQAFDAELQLSVDELESAGDETNLYDPENI